MRAAVLYAPHDLRREDWPEPVLGAGQALVQVSYNGLCGTDATEYTKGPLMVPLTVAHPGSGHVGPTVLGHEFIGTVVDTAPDARSWLGARVACGAGVSCGQCAWCRRGRTNLCARYYTLGLSTHGGLAERVAVPTGILRVIPDDCPDSEAVLAQPLAVGLHAVARAGIEPGDSVVVLGAGAIGSFVLAGLDGHDGDIVAVDVDEARLRTALELGATRTVRISSDPDPTEVADVVPGGAAVVLECSGVPGSAQRALRLAARGGRVLLVGLTKQPQALELADVVLRELDVRTTVAHVCDTDLPAALRRLARRPLASVVVDTVVPFHDVVSGFDRLATGTAGGKLIVDVSDG
jgi:(R,R)-butanediol dehydrogenase/meso-butanediol dehydrogenase/diacetyl reductase